MAEPEPTSINGAEAGSSPIRPLYSRVLLKLGGEMFGGGEVGLDPDVVALVARQIAVKATYGLWVTAAERAAMLRVLEDCPRQVVPHLHAVVVQ